MALLLWVLARPVWAGLGQQSPTICLVERRPAQCMGRPRDTRGTPRRGLSQSCAVARTPSIQHVSAPTYLADSQIGTEQEMAVALLDTCHDFAAAERLRAALLGRSISPRLFIDLRERLSLSWRELDVYLAYYSSALPGPSQLLQDIEVLSRRNVARRLGIADSTLRFHITNVRRKLGMRDRRSWLRISLPTDCSKGDVDLVPQLRGAHLTAREIEIFTGYYLSMNSGRRDLAVKLRLSDATMRTHLTNLRRKLGMTSRKPAKLSQGVAVPA